MMKLSCANPSGENQLSGISRDTYPDNCQRMVIGLHSVIGELSNAEKSRIALRSNTNYHVRTHDEKEQSNDHYR